MFFLKVVVIWLMFMSASYADVVKPALVEISFYPDKKVEVIIDLRKSYAALGTMSYEAYQQQREALIANYDLIVSQGEDTVALKKALNKKLAQLDKQYYGTASKPVCQWAKETSKCFDGIKKSVLDTGNKYDVMQAAWMTGSDELTKAILDQSDTVKDDAKETYNYLDELSKNYIKSVQNTLGDSLASIFKGEFDSIGDLWSQLLDTMLDILADWLVKVGMAWAGFGDESFSLGSLFSSSSSSESSLSGKTQVLGSVASSAYSAYSGDTVMGAAAAALYEAADYLGIVSQATVSYGVTAAQTLGSTAAITSTATATASAATATTVSELSGLVDGLESFYTAGEAGTAAAAGTGLSAFTGISAWIGIALSGIVEGIATLFTDTDTSWLPQYAFDQSGYSYLTENSSMTGFESTKDTLAGIDEMFSQMVTGLNSWSDGLGDSFAEMVGAIEPTTESIDAFVDAMAGQDIAYTDQIAILAEDASKTEELSALLVQLGMDSNTAMITTSGLTKALATFSSTDLDLEATATINVDVIGDATASATASGSVSSAYQSLFDSLSWASFTADGAIYDYHARGGIMTDPTVFHIGGEAGAEAILPLHDGPNTLEKMDSKLDALASRPIMISITGDDNGLKQFIQVEAEGVIIDRNRSGLQTSTERMII